MQLLAAGAWTLDVVFFGIFLVGIFLGVAFGFLKYVGKITGTIFSLVLAVSFCVPFKNNLESWFGLQTALYNSIGSATAASWISVAIAFVALALVVRLGAWLFGHIGTSLIDRVKPMAVINRVLGGVLGAVFAAAFIFLLLALFYWINIESVNTFINESTIVGAIYRWKWFEYAAHFSFL